MKKPNNAKERGLIKGAIRRVFSRSELRKEALSNSSIVHADPERPRVKKWSKCPICLSMTPTYKMQVDHIVPVIGLTETLEDLSWDLLVDRIWCSKENLKAICLICHKAKSKLENKERRKFQKEKKK